MKRILSPSVLLVLTGAALWSARSHANLPFPEHLLWFTSNRPQKTGDVLYKAGYPEAVRRHDDPTYDHTKRLAPPDVVAGELNYYLMEQKRETAKHADPARIKQGPGHYVTKSLMDAVRYGGDLLITEVVNLNHLDLGRWVNGKPLFEFERGLEERGAFLREPTQDERDGGLRILIRPPTRGDIQRIWEQSTSRCWEDGINLATNVGDTLQKPKDDFTGNARRVLNLLYWKHGLDLVRTIWRKDPQWAHGNLGTLMYTYYWKLGGDMGKLKRSLGKSTLSEADWSTLEKYLATTERWQRDY